MKSGNAYIRDGLAREGHESGSGNLGVLLTPSSWDRLWKLQEAEGKRMVQR